MFAEFRDLLAHDSIFHRIRGEVTGDLDKMAQQQQDPGNLNHRQRFEFLEHLDDLLDTTTDLNQAHQAVLRHAALQLTKYSPLETLGNDFDLEQLFVLPPNKQKENGIGGKNFLQFCLIIVFIPDDATSPPKKVRKSRNSDERKISTAGLQRTNDEGNSARAGSSAKANTNNSESAKIGATSKESIKPNGFSTNTVNGGDKNSETFSDSTLKADSNKMTTNGGRVGLIDYTDNKSEDQPVTRYASSKIDSDNSSTTDVKETRESAKKAEAKKSFKKPAKQNGVSKQIKNDKAANRRASERQGKSSRTPEPETKKQKKRTTTASTETTNESTTGRQSLQRRAAKNIQLNSELNSIDEQTYCLCDQISYGQMICCDNSSCKIEWYHFECVGLKVKPGKGQKW